MLVPKYEELQKTTGELIDLFNDYAKRYKPGPYSTLLKIVKNELKGRYEENVKKKPQKKTRGLLSLTYFTNTEPDDLRLNQITCITQLGTTLPETENGKEKEAAKYFGILLGSIIYRYLRLEAAYQGIFAMTSDPENCALKTTLAEVLQLSKDNELDDLTIFDCCSAYHTFLKQEKIAESFKYVQNDKDFFIKLNKIISRYQPSSESILKRIEYLHVIQNIDEILTRMEGPIQLLFPDLVKELKAAMADKQELSPEEMREFWKKYAVKLKPHEVPVLEKVLIFSRPIKKEELMTSDSTSCDLEKLFTGRLNTYKQFVLFGAYVTTLQKIKETSVDTEDPLAKKMNDALIDTINKALKINASNVLNKETLRLGFVYMELFLKIPGVEEQIKAGPWGRGDILKGYVVTTLKELDEVEESMVLKV